MKLWKSLARPLLDSGVIIVSPKALASSIQTKPWLWGQWPWGEQEDFQGPET